MSAEPIIDIQSLILDGTAIQRAQRRSLARTLERHKRLGNPIVVWRDGKIVWIPADEIRIPDESMDAESNP